MIHLFLLLTFSETYKEILCHISLADFSNLFPYEKAHPLILKRLPICNRRSDIDLDKKVQQPKAIVVHLWYACKDERDHGNRTSLIFLHRRCCRCIGSSIDGNSVILRFWYWSFNGNKIITTFWRYYLIILQRFCYFSGEKI